MKLAEQSGLHGMDGVRGTVVEGDASSLPSHSHRRESAVAAPFLISHWSLVIRHCVCLLLLAAAFAASVIPAAGRELIISNGTINRGETNIITISLNSEGDENAIEFSIFFDTNNLRY